jgi:5-methylcytosine-specific restriction endonuclease McrA
LARANITVIGTLRFSEEEGASFSIEVGKGSSLQTVWLDIGSELPDAYNWPGLGKYPEKPEPKPVKGRSQEEILAVINANKAVEEEWTRACEAYRKARSKDPRFKAAVREFVDLQNREPQRLYGEMFWIYKNTVCRLETKEPEAMRNLKTDALFVKHYVLRRERDYERVQREVEALENLEKLEKGLREPIPETVRLFVWQRDGGKCVRCGARERLEFDHIIPVAAGGSNTERNVQLLCEPCNRSKGSSI